MHFTRNNSTVSALRVVRDVTHTLFTLQGDVRCVHLYELCPRTHVIAIAQAGRNKSICVSPKASMSPKHLWMRCQSAKVLHVRRKCVKVIYTYCGIVRRAFECVGTNAFACMVFIGSSVRLRRIQTARPGYARLQWKFHVMLKSFWLFWMRRCFSFIFHLSIDLDTSSGGMNYSRFRDWIIPYDPDVTNYTTWNRNYC